MPASRAVKATIVGGGGAPGLMHQAVPASNEGVVMGLAAYRGDVLGKYERFVGTLRFTGYAGHVILGVNPNLSRRERDYVSWLVGWFA